MAYVACGKAHGYIVEVIGQPARYSGDDADAAVGALCGIDLDGGEEGYVVAEHWDNGTVYCPSESSRIEYRAIAASVL